MRISDWSSDVCSSDLTISIMLDHIDYVADLVGWQHVAIGTDWPLQAPREILQALLQPANTLIGSRKDRQSVVSGKSVSVRVEVGGRRIITKKRTKKAITM